MPLLFVFVSVVWLVTLVGQEGEIYDFFAIYLFVLFVH